MTREEAQEILSVDASSSTEVIRKSYQELFSDYQIRLTNAPTPALKKLYKGNLTKLDDAFKLLCPNQNTDMVQDLPSAEPTGGGVAMPPKAVAGKPPTPSKTQAKEKKGASSNTTEEDQKKAKKQERMLLIAGLVTVLAVAGCSYLIMNKFKDSSKIEEQATSLQEVEYDFKAFQKEFAPVAENGEFKVENVSTKDYFIAWYAATYKDEKTGEFKSFDFEDPLIKGKAEFPYLESGKSVQLEYTEGGKTVWNGSVVFYAIEIYDARKQQSFYYSGVWSQDTDDGVLKINP